MLCKWLGSSHPRERRWSAFYRNLEKLAVGAVRTSDIFDLDRICPMADSNWLEFGWVGYI
jgi:hypothetical protein